MAKVRVLLTFPRQFVDQPVIYYLGKNYNLVTNIRRANVSEGKGWVALEIEGEQEDIDAGIGDLEAKGVRVSTVEGDVIE
jgi:hypothetical protein